MRRRQREKTVQHRALEWLARDYHRAAPRRSKVMAIAEACLHRSREYHGRADGLLVIERAGCEVLTVALEVKSSRTRGSLRAISAEVGCVPSLFALATLALASLWFLHGQIGW